MRIVHQPFDGQLGDMLVEQLESGQYDELVLCVAFAKTSGVKRVRPALEQFKNDGGTIIAFVGIDFDGTSYEALLSLLEVCDELYVVHTESRSQTFHPKIYDLSNHAETWTVVGSNNLTAGGLWGNFEAFVLAEHDLGIPEDAEAHGAIEAMEDRFTNGDDNICVMITSVEDILELREQGYVNKEAATRIGSGAGGGNKKGTGRFAKSLSAPVPPAPQEDTGSEDEGEAQQAAEDPVPVTEPEDSEGDTGIAKPTAGPALPEDPDIVWFETGAMTGGSSNQLDLSMTARVESGSPIGTRFMADDAPALGGVTFFGVDPWDTGVKKNVTINYDGIDYSPCTIDFYTTGARPNGTWRIKLGGSNDEGATLHSAVGGFTHKVITLQEIGPDRYSLGVYEEEEIEDLAQASVLVARNGKTGSSRLFGLL